MTFTIQRARTVGALLWLTSVQYYITQCIVAAIWPDTNGYSWLNNTISDLANTHCGAYGAREVCSPGHTAMNASFIVLGLTMIVGAWLISKDLAKNWFAQLGFYGIILSGVGTILVGLFPENTISNLHILGAALPFAVGNLSMIIIGVTAQRVVKGLRLFTVASGAVGLVALPLFLTHRYLGLGIGGMERIVGYPLSIWMIIMGAYFVATSLGLLHDTAQKSRS